MSSIYEEFVNEFVADYLAVASEVDKPDHITRKLEFSDRAKSEARGACIMFLRIAKGALSGNEDRLYDLSGGDFWLSRNGHGSGFFCRGDEEFWEKLQDIAETYQARGLFVNKEFEYEFVPR